ncbi:MAG TPA: helix-turn-helix domain-containing protein [Candidatus Acidoferrum sp.]|nr:helix-turn-helix domain-containing protein [Candidatus Acidoferrum sp.]
MVPRAAVSAIAKTSGVNSPFQGGISLEDIEHALVEMALKQSNGNQIKAAMLLEDSRDTLRNKMKRLDWSTEKKSNNLPLRIREKKLAIGRPTLT